MRKAFEKGQVVNVDLGNPPNEIKGHEQAKERPCVIIQVFAPLQLAIVIPVSGNAPSSHLYTVVSLPVGSGGLIKDSFALCHQIRVVSFERISRHFGKLGNREFLKIKAVLSDTLEL